MNCGKSSNLQRIENAEDVEFSLLRESCAVGKNGDILPDGTAKLVKAGARIRFNLHYHASGTETVDRTRVGLTFYPKGYVPKYHQISLQIANAHPDLDIPPNTVSRHDGYYRFSKPARITAALKRGDCAINDSVL